jgi:glycosyltransferase involved in cell wall biosynthesis
VGGAEARNQGVRAAAGEWIAFLDDDDEWDPAKLETQLRAAAASPHRWPVVASRLTARTPRGDYRWPRRLPDPGEPLGDYLFARRGLFQGEGMVQTSTLLVPRDLLLRIPFTPGLPGHHEWDWLLRAEAAGAAVQIVPEALVIWYAEEERPGVTAATEWRDSLRWVHARRAELSPRAFAGFLLTTVSARAAAAGSGRAFWSLPWLALRAGRPRPLDLLVHAGLWLVPQPRRRWLRSLLSPR